MANLEIGNIAAYEASVYGNTSMYENHGADDMTDRRLGVESDIVDANPGVEALGFESDPQATDSEWEGFGMNTTPRAGEKFRAADVKAYRAMLIGEHANPSGGDIEPTQMYSGEAANLLE